MSSIPMPLSSPAAFHGESMSKGKQYSLMLHVGLLLIMIFGIPDFMHRRFEPEPVSISVDILPIAPISNVKPQEKTEPVREKKPEAERKTEKKPTVEARKVEAKPQEKPIPIPAKDVIKALEKKPEKVKKKPKEEDLDSILKSVQDTAKAEKSDKPTEQAVKEPNKNEAKSETYDSSRPLSMSELDAIRQQFQQCWNPPAGAKDVQNLAVTLHIVMNEDGSVASVEMAGDRGRYNSDSFFHAAADSAMRAVRKCSPLKNLPTEKYGTWKEMDLMFDPKDML